MKLDMGKSLYIELLKKTLAYMLWDEDLIPGFMPEDVHFFQKHHIPFAELSKAGLVLMKVSKKSKEEQETGKIMGNIWPKDAHTMIGLKRLENIQFCVETVIEDNIPGDLIETGVWRGGACIFMRGLLKVHEVSNRKVFVADSFEGMPKPNASYQADSTDQHHTLEYLAVSQEQVAENFAKYGLLDEQVQFIKGWFKDSLPIAPIDKLAVLRLDGDMYSSTMDALNALYHKLSPGGFCIVDDYGCVPQCKQAVDDFRATHKIHESIIPIDWTGVYWRKTR